MRNLPFAVFVGVQKGVPSCYFFTGRAHDKLIDTSVHAPVVSSCHVGLQNRALRSLFQEFNKVRSDTVVVCTMTAIVLIITGQIDVGANVSFEEGVLLTSSAFASASSAFPWILLVAVILFAFSTMISWSYYGYQAWSFLFGRGRSTEYTYKILFCLFVIIGSASSLGNVINFSDAMIFAMMVPNMIGLVILAPKVKEELAKYMKAIKSKK